MKSLRLALGLILTGVLSLPSAPSFSRDGGLLERLTERRNATGQKQGESSAQDLYLTGKGKNISGSLGDRSYILYLPANDKKSAMPLLIVLHGGMGNGEQIKSYIGLEPFADKYGFLIAYMNGTAVTRLLSEKRAGWNAGECCGQPQKNNVDDVAFIKAAVADIAAQYPVDMHRIYGTGHSNGGMMTYRMLCESDLYQGAVVYAGTLELAVDRCPLAQGKPILALHGAQDENLPPEGGHSKNGINKETDYRSQSYTAGVFERSGANYKHITLPNATHNPESINADLIASEGRSLPSEIVSFLALDR